MTTAMIEEDNNWDDEVEIDDYKQTVRLAKGLAAHNVKPLPEDYKLGEHDVICGRGRKCFQHTGNQRFRKLVADMLPKYSESPSKLDKTFIICDVVNRVRENSPNGGFVKKDPITGRYFEVGDFLAREKTSQAFRDALHDQYKSSNAAKKKRRLQDQGMQMFRQNSAPHLLTSDMQEFHVMSNRSSFDATRGCSFDANNGSFDSSAGNFDSRNSFTGFDANNRSSFEATRNGFDAYGVETNNFLFPEQPERRRKMQKRFSAPMLNVSYADQCDNNEGFNNNNNNNRSSNAHSFMLDDYSMNAIKFQPIDMPQLNADLISGQFEKNNFVSNFRPTKRHSLAGPVTQESMRCIIDEAHQTANSDWFEPSCPKPPMTEPLSNVVSMVQQPEEADDESVIAFTRSSMFSERHHSEPDLSTASLMTSHMSSGNSNMMLKHSVSNVSDDTDPTSSDNATFDIFESRIKTPTTFSAIHDDNIILSPIGDGNAQGLFDMLKGFGDNSDDKDIDLFNPLPL